MKTNWQLFENLIERIRKHLLTFSFSCLLLTSVLSLIFSFWISSSQANRLFHSWSSSNEMIVYLKKNNQPKQLIQTLKNKSIVESVEYLSSQQTKKELEEAISQRVPDLFKDVDFEEAFPARLKITLHNQPSLDHINSLKQSLAKESEILEVVYGIDWMSRFEGIQRWMQYLILFISGTLALCASFIIAYCMKVAMVQRQDEIEIMTLLGATKSAIRLPFLIEGLFLGGLSSALSVLVTLVLFSSMNHFVHQDAPLLGDLFSTNSIQFSEILILIFFSLILSFIGSFTAVESIFKKFRVT